MKTLCEADMSVGDLAELLFCSSLQPSQRPTAQAVRIAVRESLRRHNDSLRECAAHVASCYGNNPEQTCARMRWARSLATASFLDRNVAA
jgi:hypothetical protein